MKKDFRYAVYTNAGSRPVNEDALTVSQNGENFCFVLCDGLGGHGMGDVASQIVTQVFNSQFHQTDKPSDFLAEGFQAAQDILLAEQKARHAERKMKTTAVALAVDRRKAYIGHIGDSRAYVFQRGKVRCRTLDHSIPQMLANAGDIREDQIRNHPDRNIVLRVMGVEWDDPMYELMKPISLWQCQAFLLCSDGFWELIEESDMCETLSSAQSPDDWLEKMASIIKVNGTDRDMDNFSAIAVWRS